MRITILALVALVAGCAGGDPAADERRPGAAAVEPARLDASFAGILAEYRIATAGAALIRNGRIVWTGYYGEQAPGVPASRETLFNTASIAKTVTADTVLRLADYNAKQRASGAR
jgi:CubicO group peptidase (beta-lactamase class C family)